MANRVYPNASDVPTWYANKSNAVSSASDVTVGEHIGPASAGGVSPASSFDGYTAVHRIDNPSDGINNSANFVVYFSKDGADPKELWKATDADVSTLVKIDSGPEHTSYYDFTNGHK